MAGSDGGTRPRETLLAQIVALGWVVDKEMRETVRDPHVLLFLLFPIAVYPLMLWVSLQIGAIDEGWREQQAWRIDVQGPDPLVDALLEGNTAADAGLAGLDDGTVDLVARTEVRSDDAWSVTLTHTSRRPRSAAALHQAEKRLRDLRRERLEARARAAGLDEDALDPLEVAVEIEGGSASTFQWVVGLLVAVLMPTSLMLSGLYPAIDMMVGERERGTLETTMVSGAPRWVLSAGRVLATMLFQGIGAAGNLVGIALTASSLSVSLQADAPRIWLPPPSMLLALPALAATALCVTGVLMFVLLPARTFKEGEWLGSVVLLAALGPLAAAVPALIGDEPPGLVMLVPMANTTVALARAMEGTMSFWIGVVPVLVNAGIGAALFAVTLRVAGTEAWLLEGRLPRWLAWLRRWMPQ